MKTPLVPLVPRSIENPKNASKCGPGRGEYVSTQHSRNPVKTVGAQDSTQDVASVRALAIVGLFWLCIRSLLTSVRAPAMRTRRDTRRSPHECAQPCLCLIMSEFALICTVQTRGRVKGEGRGARVTYIHTHIHTEGRILERL
jgi:hypothetical protein